MLEPVGEKINERVKAPAGLGSRLGFRSAKSEWFRIYRVSLSCNVFADYLLIVGCVLGFLLTIRILRPHLFESQHRYFVCQRLRNHEPSRVRFYDVITKKEG